MISFFDLAIFYTEFDKVLFLGYNYTRILCKIMNKYKYVYLIPMYCPRRPNFVDKITSTIRNISKYFKVNRDQV